MFAVPFCCLIEQGREGKAKGELELIHKQEKVVRFAFLQCQTSLGNWKMQQRHKMNAADNAAHVKYWCLCRIGVSV